MSFQDIEACTVNNCSALLSIHEAEAAALHQGLALDLAGEEGREELQGAGAQRKKQKE